MYRPKPPTPVGEVSMSKYNSKSEILESAQMFMSLERTMRLSADAAMDEAAQKATEKDIEKGLCSKLMTRKQADEIFGEGKWRPIKRFTIKQGGKYRCIDDGKFSGHNRASVSYDRMHTVNYDMLIAVIGKMRDAVSNSSGTKPEKEPLLTCIAAVDDESSAFRQKPTAE